MKSWLLRRFFQIAYSISIILLFSEFAFGYVKNYYDYEKPVDFDAYSGGFRGTKNSTSPSAEKIEKIKKELKNENSQISKCSKLAKKVNLYKNEKTSSENYKSYIKNCLSYFKDLPADLKGKIERSIGILVVKKIKNEKEVKESICTAIRVAPKLLLTARHCIGFGSNMRPDGNFNKLWFILLGAPNKLIKISKVIDNPEHIENKESLTYEQYDYVLLETKEGLEHIKIPSISISKPKKLSRLIVFGLSSLIEKHSDNPNEIKRDWRKAFHWDKDGLCYIADIQGRCIFHGCQTSFTSSGAPLLSFSKNSINLVGVHSGSARHSRIRSLYKKCPEPNSENLEEGNKGVLIGKEVCDEIKKRNNINSSQEEQCSS